MITSALGVRQPDTVDSLIVPSPLMTPEYVVTPSGSRTTASPLNATSWFARIAGLVSIRETELLVSSAGLPPADAPAAALIWLSAADEQPIGNTSDATASKAIGLNMLRLLDTRGIRRCPTQLRRDCVVSTPKKKPA